MSGSLGAFDTANQPRIPERDESLQLAPAEGWTTFLAVLVMLLAAAWAIDDANWAGYVPGTDVRQTEFLPLGVVLAAITGLLLAKSRLTALQAHLVGSVAGAAYILLAISGAISRKPGVVERLRDLNESVVTFVNDVVALGIRSAETSVFLLILGALVWAAGQLATFSVFRRHRALPAIAIPSAILLVNMSVTIRDQYLHLVVLAAAALWLLVRMNLLQQMAGWRSRRIGDGGYVSELFMRSGAVFVALALVGSVALAANASSAPLARYWRDMNDELLEVGYELNRWIGGVSGPARGPTNIFSPTQTIRDFWETSPQLVLTATSTDGEGHYLRGGTYDAFDGRTWQQTDRVGQQLPIGSDLLAGTAEQIPSVEGRHEVTVTVTSADLGGDMLVSPESPVTVDRPVELQTHDAGGPLASARIADGLEPGETFSVTALARDTDRETALTGSQLAAAGLDYSAYPWITRYIEIRDGSIGDRVYRETERIVDGLPPQKRNPYHIAEAIQDFLYTDGFTYQTDVRGLCAGQNLVDCFLQVRRGYCEYFATTMVMMLRTRQIPARYAVGYLPGQLVDGIWNVDRSAAHAWVEVFFPGHGWMRFDPTPGNLPNGQRPTRLDPGEPLSTPQGGNAPDRTPRFTAGPVLDPEGDLGLGESGRQPDTPGQTGGGLDLLGPLALIVIAVVGLLLLVIARFRRLPGVEPDLAFRGVARLAARFGHGPRPTQTAYEFSDDLAVLVPTVRGELRVVATAKVESTYARRQPQGDALAALRDAYAKVRVGLLRLLFRRPSLPRRPRSTNGRRGR